MSIYIDTAIDVPGGTLGVTLTEGTAFVEFLKPEGTSVVIEDCCGDVVDWYDLYQNKWLSLSEAEIKEAEIKYAQDYAKDAFLRFSSQLL